jgi:hypothetical protein
VDEKKAMFVDLQNCAKNVQRVCAKGVCKGCVQRVCAKGVCKECVQRVCNPPLIQVLQPLHCSAVEITGKFVTKFLKKWSRKKWFLFVFSVLHSYVLYFSYFILPQISGYTHRPTLCSIIIDAQTASTNPTSPLPILLTIF